MSSQFDADIPVASAPILILSLPESQDTPQDVFHTPPEEQPLPSSVDVEPCAVNEAFHAFSQTQGSVDLSALSQGSDLGKDSKLGFAEAQLSHEVVTKFKPDCSPGTKGDGLVNVPEPRFKKVRVLERETSDLGELPAKKLKPLEENLGKLVSDGESVETQENGMGCDQMDAVAREGEDFYREIAMGNEEHASRRVLPASVNGEATAEVKSSEVKEKAGHCLFDILRALADHSDDEHEDEDEDEDNGDLNSLFKALKESGITLPRPRWWPDDLKSVLPVEKAPRDK